MPRPLKGPAIRRQAGLPTGGESGGEHLVHVAAAVGDEEDFDFGSDRAGAAGFVEGVENPVRVEEHLPAGAGPPKVLELAGDASAAGQNGEFADGFGDTPRHGRRRTGTIGFADIIRDVAQIVAGQGRNRHLVGPVGHYPAATQVSMSRSN